MKIIAHRGAKGLSPENTLAAFKKAIAHKADEIEFDLRVTSDKKVVIHHDAYITEPDNSRLVIRSTPLVELRRHKADLLTFEELVKQLGNRVHMLIEIKPDEPVAPIISALNKQLRGKLKTQNISIASFDFKILQTMHRAFPDVEMVVNEKWFGIRARLRCRKLGTKRISMNQKWLYRSYLKMAKRGGFEISPYTVNNVARAKKWQPYVYGIITDRPDLFEK